MNDDASRWLDRITASTDRLLASAAALTDAGMREPSLLPGWTRGHVLTHIARNADGLGNLLRWARSGTQTPMYASAQARAADIEAGAGRPAADLTADVASSAAAFAAQAADMPDEAWTAQVRALAGPPFPAFAVLARRLSEVEIHHADLAAGYRPADWPADFTEDTLPRVAVSFAGREDTPRCWVWVTGSPYSYRIGPDGASPPSVFVHGQATDLLAWLTGRGDGSGLRVSGDLATLPVLPAWR